MKYYAGIDLGGTFIKCGIVDEKGNLIAKDKIPTGKERGYTEIARDMAHLAKRLAENAHVELTAVGIGSPGTIDSANGVIVYSNNIAWKNVPLGESIRKKLQLSVSVTNDANAAALGESWRGAGKDYKNIILITLGTGVGGGIGLNGRVDEGNRSAGAELGHTVIKIKGEKCTCGRRGCFEAYSSATALIRQTQRAMARESESALWRLCGGKSENVDGKTAFDGMRSGDKTAIKVVNDYIRYLAEGVANFANIFRPEAVLLGGGICAEGETLLVPLEKQVDKMLFGGTHYAPVKILRASLGNDAGLYGAALLAIQTVNSQ